MQRFFLSIILAMLGCIHLSAQPVVNDGGVVNGASYASGKLPGGGVAQGSIFIVFGTGMGPLAGALAGFPLPNTLGGTSIKVTSSGQTLDCPLIYSFPGQVAAVLPSATPVGNATLSLTFNGATSLARAFRVVSSSFGILTLNSAGTGPGVITNFETASSQPVNTAIKAANPNQTLILYGTGLGALPAGNADNAPAPAVAINQANVEVYVGNKRATLAYAGRAPGFAGLDQINLVVPTGIEGCSVPVVIKTGNLISNYATIAVASTGSICQDPIGLSSTQLQTISNGGSVKQASIALARIDLEISVPIIGTQSYKLDSGNASFKAITADSLARGAQLNAGNISSLGTCLVYNNTLDKVIPVDPAVVTGLDAGALINISGTKGAKSLKLVTKGTYSETLASGGLQLPFPIPGVPSGGDPEGYLVPGNYTFNNGSGGADVGAFNTSFTLPSNINWTNKAAITSVVRGNGQTVTWTGGDADTYVQIYGYSAADTSSNPLTGFFSCTERASVGTFTVPAVVLLALPPTPTGSLEGFTPTATLAVGKISAAKAFTAPGIDTGLIVSTSQFVKTVLYQ